MTANVLAYARWHARDALPRALAPVALFAAIGGVPLWSIVGGNGLAAVRTDPELVQLTLAVYRQAMSSAMTLGAVLMLSGWVAEDRDKGHVRFLFSAPVVAWQHYLLRAAVGTALFAACFVAIPLGFGAVLTPVPVVPVFTASVLYALLFGGLALLAGAITRRDGAVVIVVALAAALLQQVALAEGVPPTVRWLAALLPPIVPADQVRTAWLAGEAAATGDLARTTGYAVGMFVAALAIIRRAPLVR